MNTSKNISELQLLASSQWGLFTSAQAQSIGVGRTQLSRMVSGRRIESISFGVYRFTSGEVTSLIDIKATWLSIFPKESAFARLKKTPFDAVVAGRTAAYIHGLGDFYASPYTFITQERKQATRKDIKFLKWKTDEDDVIIVEGLPVATVERTVADLIRLKEDMSLVDDVIKDAAQSNRPLNQNKLAILLAPLAARNGYPRHDGTAFARALIERNSNSWEKLIETFGAISSHYVNAEAMAEAIDRALSKYVDPAAINNIASALLEFGNRLPANPDSQQIMVSALEQLKQRIPSLPDKIASDDINDEAMEDVKKHDI